MSDDTVISIAALEHPAWLSASSEDLDFPVKSIMRRASYPPPLSVNGLLIALLCTVLLVFIGFVPVSIPSPLSLSSHLPYQSLPMIQYTFQLPLALFIGAFLGPFLGTLSVLIFLIVGLAYFPVFANGGGWDYIREPGFGYLAGMLLLAYFLGKTFHQAFHKKAQASRSLKIFLRVVVSVLLVHGIGILYLVALALAGQIPPQELSGWILHLSIETAPYDLLAAGVFLCMVRQTRLALWLILY